MMLCFVRTFILLLCVATPLRAAVDIQEVVSPGGIKAWLVEEHSIPFTALEIRFSGGASLDREGKRGAAYLMTGLLNEGAGELDAQAYARRVEELSAKFDYGVDVDSLGVSAQFLKENQDEALEVLKLTLTDPRFDEDAVERVRGQVLSILASDDQDPQALAYEAFFAAAYDGHPYAFDFKGNAESVKGLTKADLQQSFKDLVRREGMVVSAVGDVTPAELGVMLDNLLGSLPEKAGTPPKQAEYQLSGGVTVVDYASPQSVAVFGHEGIKRDDPDFVAAYVMNEILGGQGFESRLMIEVREKRGLTYGIGTDLLPYDHAELYMGQFASSNDRIAQAISLVRDEWQKLSDGGVTQEELDAAKTFLTGAFPLRFDGNSTIASILAGMQADDLPISYIAPRNDKINAVTLEDVKRVAKRLLKPESLHFVVAGQPEGLE